MEELTSGAGTADPGIVASTVGDTPAPTTPGTTSAPLEQSTSDATAGSVQGESPTTTETDYLADVPSLEDLTKLPDDSQYKKSLIQMRTAIEQTFKPKLEELSGKFKPFESVADRFESPEQFQSVIQLHDNLIGWTKDTQTGELVPATQAGAEQLAQQYPRHADFLAADLLNMPTVDSETGKQYATRLDLALEEMATIPEQRAKVAQMFGLVEPSSISPQWQPTEEQLAVVRPELQGVFKQLPYEEREDLSTNSPDFINRTLEREKFTQELQQEREQSQQREQQQVQAREQYVAQQAAQAGEQYVNSQESEALTTFTNSVVEQCNFIQSLDMANLPQGMAPEQATQMNRQIAALNKAEGIQIVQSVVNLMNPQTRPYAVPHLKEIGIIDDKFMKELDEASNKFSDNGRNYGELTFRGQLRANGQGFQPDASITNLRNYSLGGLAKMVHLANQLKSRLMEQRSQFFQVKATDHNQTLNNVAASRQLVRGSAYDPNTATAQQPQGWMSRADIERIAGA